MKEAISEYKLLEIQKEVKGHNQMMSVDIAISWVIGKTVVLNIGEGQEGMVAIEEIDLFLVLLRVLNLIDASKI